MRVIIVDDGSPEADRVAAEAHACDFAQTSGIDMLFLVNPQNLGRPKTRNRLLDAVEADYITWLDAGDIWYPQKLEVQFNHLSRLRMAGVDLDRIWVTGAYDWQQAGSASARTLQQQVQGDQVLELLDGGNLRAYLWTLLGTARAFRSAGRFDERLPRLQDLDYFLHFVRGGGKLVVPEGRQALCCYFKSDIGRDAREVHACHMLILAKMQPVIQTQPPALRSRLYYRANRLAARFALNNGKRVLAAGYLAQAAFGSPRHALRVAKAVLTGKAKRT
jgi:glycosyltransferase involved in cell wall biosynthesis